MVIKENGNRRMDKEKGSGGILVELREMRKVMEEILKVMRRVAVRLERREEAEQKKKRSEIRRGEGSTGAQESRVERGRKVGEEGREQEVRRKVEEIMEEKTATVEGRKEGREEPEKGKKMRGRLGGGIDEARGSRGKGIRMRKQSG